MPELRIPFDPCNPGQFYACCGLIELFDLSGAQTLSKFEVDTGCPREATFVLTGGSQISIESALSFLKEAEYTYLVRPASKRRRGQKTEHADNRLENVGEEDKTAPLRVLVAGKQYVIDWWLDEFRDKTTALKCWPGRASTRTVVTTLVGGLPATITTICPFQEAGAYVKGRFGVDPNSAWDALDLGYSPHAQNEDVLTYSLVEMLAAFGLQGFRPYHVKGDQYRYCLWGSPLPRCVARATCALAWIGLDSTTYQFRIKQRSSFARCFAFSE